MTFYILDASVAAKWFLPPDDEPHQQQALALLQDYISKRVHFIVPDLFWLECGNILWKAVRQERVSSNSARESIATLVDMPLPAVSAKTLLNEAFDISASFDRTVYDAAYVALAVASKRPLITDDQRLANALDPYFPVKWLGNYTRAH